MRNFKMVLAYDGTRYRGWQRLGNTQNTIQTKLETALSRLCGEPVAVHGSGRTDAGAHAAGQVASFHSGTALSCAALLARLREVLPEDIGVLSLQEAEPRFHARLNAVRKTYRYRVWTDEQPCVFERRYVYFAPGQYDLARMRAAARLFLAEHDFLGFCANKPGKKSTVRRIDVFEIEPAGQELHFTVTGNGFLHHMVRIMVGTLLQIGSGEREPESIAEIFQTGCRAEAGPAVPAAGLCLMRVEYRQQPRI